VSDAERDAWLERAWVFAMPSRVPAGGPGGEGFGIVYLEAAARGLPVVAGDRGGAVDAVDGGRTGLLVDATDHLAVADALTTLLLDRERAEEMGRAGRERAREFAWPLVSARVERLLLELAAAAA
jgi:phosphatidylinositol alpha-1,6-mannosyltransferase